MFNAFSISSLTVSYHPFIFWCPLSSTLGCLFSNTLPKAWLQKNPYQTKTNKQNMLESQIRRLVLKQHVGLEIRFCVDQRFSSGLYKWGWRMCGTYLSTQVSFVFVSGVFMSALVRLLKEPPTKREIMKPQVCAKWHFYDSAAAGTNSSLCLYEAHVKLWKLAMFPCLYYQQNHGDLPGIRWVLVSKTLYQARKGNKRHPCGKGG